MKNHTFLSEKINIDKKLILPRACCKFISGSHPNFFWKGQIISYSPLKIIGETIVNNFSKQDKKLW